MGQQFNPSRVRVPGPLAPYAPGFVVELAGQGYRPKSAVHQLRLMAHLSRWLAGEDLEVAGLTAPVVEAFVAARRSAGYTTLYSGRAMERLLAYLRALGLVGPLEAAVTLTAAEELIERYRSYLLVERGLAVVTVVDYVSHVRPFIAGRGVDGGLDLESLQARDVTAFVVTQCPGHSRVWGKHLVCALRSLLRFLHVTGVLGESLIAAVPSVASWRLTGLPRGLEPAQVRSVLASCDRGTANGRRDFAILTLLVRMGLRAGELAALELEDLDWRAGEIVVRGKGDRQERLPLPADVGSAVAGYLRRDRPATAEGRNVFVRVRPPHRALTGGGVTQVVAAAGRRAGVGVLYAHRLRHTAATEMLRAGAPLGEIGQVLRHRRLQTTAIYAKVDREALRSLARPWPQGGAS
jgi:integrase/recombinase XerD